MVFGGDQRGRHPRRERRAGIAGVMGAIQRLRHRRRVTDPRQDQQQPGEHDRAECGQRRDRAEKPLGPPETATPGPDRGGGAGRAGHCPPGPGGVLAVGVRAGRQRQGGHLGPRPCLARVRPGSRDGVEEPVQLAPRRPGSRADAAEHGVNGGNGGGEGKVPAAHRDACRGDRGRRHEQERCQQDCDSYRGDEHPRRVRRDQKRVPGPGPASVAPGLERLGGPVGSPQDDEPGGDRNGSRHGHGHADPDGDHHERKAEQPVPARNL